METDKPDLLTNQGREPAAKGPMKALVAGGMHYIRPGDGGEELYSLERDPEERTNLAGVAEARGSLEGFVPPSGRCSGNARRQTGGPLRSRARAAAPAPADPSESRGVPITVSGDSSPSPRGEKVLAGRMRGLSAAPRSAEDPGARFAPLHLPRPPGESLGSRSPRARSPFPLLRDRRILSKRSEPVMSFECSDAGPRPDRDQDGRGAGLICRPGISDPVAGTNAGGAIVASSNTDRDDRPIRKRRLDRPRKRASRCGEGGPPRTGRTRDDRAAGRDFQAALDRLGPGTIAHETIRNQRPIGTREGPGGANHECESAGRECGIVPDRPAGRPWSSARQGLGLGWRALALLAVLVVDPPGMTTSPRWPSRGTGCPRGRSPRSGSRGTSASPRRRSGPRS